MSLTLKNHKQQGYARWSVVLVTLLMLCLVIGYYMFKSQHRPSVAMLHTDSGTNAVTQSQVPNYTFYQTLRTQKVTVPKDSVQPLKLVKYIYTLQFATVRDYNAAKTLANEIGAIGIPANVNSTAVHGQTWYQVVSDSYGDENAAETVQDQLREQHIDSLLLRKKNA